MNFAGDLVLFTILTYKTYYQDTAPVDKSALKPSVDLTGQQLNATEPLNGTSSVHSERILPDYLQLPDSYNLPDLLFYMFLAMVSSQVMYHGLCGFLQLYFYTLQRDQPEKWKCQPHRFLTRSNEMHEIIVGTLNMFLASGIMCLLLTRI